MWKNESLSAMQAGRLSAALARPYRFSDGIRSLKAELERNPDKTKSESDGMIDWSRSKFNRMDGREQAAYEARLKAKRYYFVGGLAVPKIVFDAVA